MKILAKRQPIRTTAPKQPSGISKIKPCLSETLFSAKPAASSNANPTKFLTDETLGRAKKFFENWGKSSAIAFTWGAMENYGLTSEGGNPHPAPGAQWAPNAIFDKHITWPLHNWLKTHGMNPNFGSYPYWGLCVAALPLIPLMIQAYRAHKKGESLKPYVADAGILGLNNLTVEDAGYWAANPIFHSSPNVTGINDSWMSQQIPFVGKFLGANIPGLGIPLAYAVTGAVVGAYGLYLYLKNHPEARKKIKEFFPSIWSKIKRTLIKTKPVKPISPTPSTEITTPKIALTASQNNFTKI